MPLSTQIIRNGKSLKVGWSDYHVAAMAIAATLDQPVEERKLWENNAAVEAQLVEQNYPESPMPISPGMAFRLCDYGALSLTPLNSGSVVLEKPHRFQWVFMGETEWTEFELLPGDELRAWR